MIAKQTNTLVHLLRTEAEAAADKTLYRFLHDGKIFNSFTYAQLDQQARTIAAHLQSLTTGGERVLLLYPTGLEFVSAFFACLYAGLIAVPCHPPKRNRIDTRLQAIAEDAQANLVLTTSNILQKIDKNPTSKNQLNQLPWLATDTLDANTGWRMPSLKADTLAFLQYTSGSTGTPKGVMVSHGNLLANLAYINRAAEFTPADIDLCWLPNFHDMGLINGIINPVYSGMYTLLMSPDSFLQRPERWLQAISEHQVTCSGGPDFAYQLCVDRFNDAALKNLDLSTWRCAFSGAEPIRQTTLDRFVEKFSNCGFKRRYFYPCYGLAEVTVAATGAFIDEEPKSIAVGETALSQHQVMLPAQNGENHKKVLVGCGHAWSDMEVRIVNPKTKTVCSSHEVGEIWLKGPSVAQGYWQKTAETRETFQAMLGDTGDGPFLRTGDLGLIKDHELFVTGRIKDLIIIRGRNYYPEDIELTVSASHAALQANSGIACTINVNDREHLLIVHEVNRHNVKKLDAKPVFDAIRKAVTEEYGLQVYAIALIKPFTLPKTSSGKRQRILCAEHFLTKQLSTINQSVLTMNETEQQDAGENILVQKILANPEPAVRLPLLELYLQQSLAEILKKPATAIDTEELIIGLGIDSMIAAAYVTAIEDTFSITLQVEDLLEHATIASLAVSINTQLAERGKTDEN